LADSVGIRVTDAAGAANAEVPVAWTALDGGKIESLGARTDSLGQAWARWTLGPRAGTQHARVQVGNPRTMPAVSLTATALPGAAAVVKVESGAGQNGAVGAVLRQAIVVRLTDGAGNPVAGAQLHVATATGSVPDTLVAADPQGRVSLKWTLAREAGSQWLELKADSGASTKVNARAMAREPANVTSVEGTAPTSAPAGRALPKPLVFSVTDAYGNTISDVPLVFTSSSGTVAPVRVMTDAHGRAATHWTLGPAIADQMVTATVRGTSIRTTLTVHAVKAVSHATR
jgi:hypothetical protein